MFTQWSWTMKSFICHAWREQSGIELFSNRVISSSWVNLKTYIRMTGVTSYNNISQCQCHGYSYTRRRIRYHCIVRSSAVDLCLHAGIYISSVIVKTWWPKDFFSFARWMWFWYRFVAVLEVRQQNHVTAKPWQRWCTRSGVSVATYFVLTGYRPSSEQGRLVLNTCIPMGLFTRESSRELQFSSLHAMWTRLNSCDPYTCKKSRSQVSWF